MPEIKPGDSDLEKFEKLGTDGNIKNLGAQGQEQRDSDNKQAAFFTRLEYFREQGQPEVHEKNQKTTGPGNRACSLL